MISNFPSKKLYNPGGYGKFYFLPHTSVDTFPMIVSGAAQVAVGLKVGHAWLEGYSTAETLNFSEESADDAHGPFYIPIISGFVPGDRPELVSLLQTMENMRFLVKLKDSLGKYKLVGSPGCPLKLLSNFSSGDRRSDLKGFAFKFTGQALYRAPDYPF